MVALLLLLLLLLLLEDLLELLDRAVVLVSQFLQFRPVLLLFFALACLLVFGLLIQELIHELVSLLGGVIELVLTLFDDFAASLVLLVAANGQSCVAGVVPLENIQSGILYNILKHLVVVAMSGS